MSNLPRPAFNEDEAPPATIGSTFPRKFCLPDPVERPVDSDPILRVRYGQALTQLRDEDT